MNTADEVKKQNKKINVILISAGIALVAATVLGAILFTQLRHQHEEDTQAISERIIKKVGQLYVLPAEETPTVAKIKDKGGLQGNQEFYTNAQNGDYVLVYQQSQTAFLYRESINKLVKVSPVTVPQPTAPSL